MRLAFFLDPFVLACPTVSDGPTAFEKYVYSLLAWKQFIDKHWASIVIPDSTVGVLFSTGHFPLWDDLARALEQLGLEGIQAQDIVVIVNGLLKKCSTVEGSLGVSDFLDEDTQLSPSAHLSGREEALKALYARILIFMALDQINEATQVANRLLISRHPDNVILVGIDSRIILIEGEWKGATPPFSIHEEFYSCNDPYALYHHLDPSGMWISSESLDTKKDAVHIATYQHHGVDCWSEKDTTCSWSFGIGFLRSCERTGFDHEAGKAKNLLRAIANCLCSKDMRDTHWLRIDSGGNSPQRLRDADGACAWRRDIDDEYHLHYWVLNGHVEFASVVLHNDFSIC